MAHPDWPMTVSLIDPKTKVPWKQQVIDGKTYYACKAGDEFNIKVMADPDVIQQLIKSDPRADQISVCVKVDGICVGVSLVLSLTHSVCTFEYFVSGSSKLAFVIKEPPVDPFQDENEAKANVERNKSSLVGSITVELKLSKSTPVGQYVAPVFSEARVPDTKKPFDRPDLGIGRGADLGPVVYGVGAQLFSSVGVKTVHVTSQAQLSYLKMKSDPQAASAAVAAAAGPQALDVVPAWSCPQCTLINTSKNCAACGKDYVFIKGEKRKASEIVDLT